MSDNIKVVVKVRPLITREIEEKLSFQWRVKNNTLYQLDANGKESGVQYTFDKVYDVSTKTTDVYEDVAKPIVEAAIDGFNGTIFAYGQTSSGKTYTMSGTEASPGIIQLAVLNLFERIKCIPDRDFLVRVSYIEIYNETLKDLLNVDNDKIRIRDTLESGIRVEATEKFTSSPEEVMEIMRDGEANRQIGATNMNVESSRSHSIFQITIESREHTEDEETAGCVNVSQLNLVDLAGSERSGQTGATGKRFKEGTHINKSLSVLALVIKQLSEDPHKHANYRDSKLTRILQNSLGGNAKTSIICAVTPAAVEETISTLQFANRAKAVKNKPEVNAVATDATKMQDLTKELSKLKSELAKKKHIEQDNRLLIKQIETLQKLVLNGFEQSSVGMGGARRKTWCAPRRMTISTSSLRGEHEEDRQEAKQRFCTPILKYNPLAFPTPRDFQPIQRPSQLPSVSEERAMVTPPPNDKKVNFSDEIIDLDSDEDNASNTSRCSPYHKCYHTSKTPPCVLRKNAKKAEETLRDIEELTKREKLYNPEVVEYMEKLEKTTQRVAELEDEIKSLSAVNSEKNEEMNQLKATIIQTKSEVQSISSAKAELEARCNDYNTKLTDLEVCYETLRAKAKLREDELLSLLNEQTGSTKTKERISGKSLSRTFDKDFGNFMDMSKDISLVSDNDSIDSSNNDPSGQLQRLIDEMRTEVTAKNEAIVKLESELLQQKLTIQSLENTCTDLREQNIKANSKLNNTNEENDLLKSSIETLNSTINSQKQNLESANNDIESYNNVIKELQTKLADKKYDSVDLNISDISLEKMIDNEEKFIANNENMRNIIHSFRIALENRNKKIEQLESNHSVGTTLSECELFSTQLEEKEKEIMRLVEETQKSKELIEENIKVINKLIEDNKNLVEGTNDLSDKLQDAEKQSSELEKRVYELESENHEYKQQLNEFHENHDKVLKNLNEFKNNISILQKEKEELCILQHEVHSKDNIIAELKSEISSKDSQLSSLSSVQIESQDYLSKWKSTVSKVQLLLGAHTGDASVQTESNDNTSMFEVLSRQLNSVENSAKQILSQKEHDVFSARKLQEETEALKLQIESLIKEKNQMEIDRESQNQQIIQLTKNLEEIQEKIHELNSQNAELNTKLQLATESQDILKNEIIEKDKTISSVKNEANDLRLQLEKALQLDEISRNEIHCLSSLLKTNETKYRQLAQEMNNEIIQLKQHVSDKDKLLEENRIQLQKVSKTLEDTIYNRDELLNNVYEATVSLLSKFENHNDEYQLLKGNVYSNIIQIVDRVSNGIVHLQTCKSTDEINNSEEITQTARLLDTFKEENQQLINKLSYLEKENSDLSVELEQIKVDNKKIINSLIKSDEVLKQLHVELHDKLSIIEDLEGKINNWKDNYAALEESMKRQILELQISNSDLELRSGTSAMRTLSIKSNETYSIGPDFNNIDSDQRQTIRKSLDTLLIEPGKYSPQSLLTLCCNKILDAIQTNETELDSVASTSNTCLQTRSAETQTDRCDCDRLLAENSIALDNNLLLKAKVDYLQSVNFELLKEQEEIRKELKFLVEPAQELKKKISNHKTSLSTLTATTYAENKLLKSQVKVLQHHNNRIFNVCQRDLPTFKKSLQELSVILKNTTSINRLEAHIKRFSLPEVLDRSSSVLKDESTLDGDLLMLDTNVTVASVDNTLLVQDQTCLDGTQDYLDTDINTDLIKTIDPNILHTQLQMLSVENEKLTEMLNALKEENLTLREKNDELSDKMKPELRKDAQSSPVKFNNSIEEVPEESIVTNGRIDNVCEYCKNENIPSKWENMIEEIKKLNEELHEVKLLKSGLEKKYNSLNEDIIANDQLVIKVNALEKNNNKQLNMIDQLTNKLSSEHKELVRLQEENDMLSTQVMEGIDESDSLRKEIDTLKESIQTLSKKCADLDGLISGNTVACMRCAHNTSTPESVAVNKSILNRSSSDSESSSRCNKLSTLQHELLAGREDCKTISEDVATIKNHFDRGELSMSHGMDLDDSMGESNVFSFAKVSPKAKHRYLVNEIPEKRPFDVYILDKTDCVNYYVEKTESENNFSEEIRIIDVMKMFYNKIIAKHHNEVENLVNKLKDYEESSDQLNQKLNSLTSEHSKINDVIKEKDSRIDCIAKTLNQLKNNINNMNKEICGGDADKNTVLVTMFKNNILSILDTDFDLCSVNVFEHLIDKVVSKHQNDLLEIMTQYSELQGHMEVLSSELKNVTENLNHMKCQLSEKEKEYNLLKAQKEKAHEISSAVTLDIVQRQQELAQIITNSCQKLIEHNIITPNDIDSSRPVDENLSLLIEKLINQAKQTDVVLQEKHNLSLEVTKSKTALEEKDQALESLKTEVDKLRELCKNATNELMIKNEALETQKSLHEELDEIYQKKAQENEANAKIIENMAQELEILKITVTEKERILETLQDQNKQQTSNESENNAKMTELIESIKNLEHENKNLKSVNDVITSESEQNAAQLAEADDTIKKNKLELEKLTAEILTLNQSMKESVSVIDSLKLEAKSLIEQNVALKKQLEEANELCSQLKLNMKTHEKTAEIQCKIISRLKQEKENNSSSGSEKEKIIKELSEQCEKLRNEFEKLAEDRNKCKHEAQELREAKEALEKRIAELENQLEGSRSHGSLGLGDPRRRRQSLLDSKRTFSDDKLDADHKKMEAYFSTQQKPDDIFMDVDDHSNRSTPARHRISDSFQSRNDESEESRPSSAMERRKRRQSIHDSHRNTHSDIQGNLIPLDEINKTNGDTQNSELATLKEHLKACQQELEELKEKYREVDEECETCAEYLRERDEQCMQLKIENKELQQQITELNEKLQNASMIRGQKDAQRSFADASVNTDEDWANLHSVVVDRMSFDREVEKNKTLQRSVDELRFKNGDLKAAIAKMQKTAERAARNKANLQELEATKLELETCKRELEEYKERCKELDEECETCGEYLRERDEQVCRLKEARDALEAKLEALQEKETGNKLQSVRKKRQSIHDQNRNSAVECRDAATETSDELLSELIDNSKLINESLHKNEVIQLKMALEQVSQQKHALETQLRAPALMPPVYVATGSAIVQNQHLTEVMKENQKLKKMNAKLITICKKRGKPLGESNRENDDPADMG